mmetsp:Transcript_8090/g.12245  ORF Transcript_8090/g.12245 Transcript_8090/m.12245 type:complete len:223 (+) Transcript_8090:545-1213(+)
MGDSVLRDVAEIEAGSGVELEGMDAVEEDAEEVEGVEGVEEGSVGVGVDGIGVDAGVGVEGVEAAVEVGVEGAGVEREEVGVDGRETEGAEAVEKTDLDPEVDNEEEEEVDSEEGEGGGATELEDLFLFRFFFAAGLCPFGNTKSFIFITSKKSTATKQLSPLSIQLVTLAFQLLTTGVISNLLSFSPGCPFSTTNAIKYKNPGFSPSSSFFSFSPFSWKTK